MKLIQITSFNKMNNNCTTFQHDAEMNTMLVITGIIHPAVDDFFYDCKKLMRMCL